MTSLEKYTTEERDLILRARKVAEEALQGLTRDNGRPFMDHPDAVARIVASEVGLGAPALAAVYLHEATHRRPEDLALLGKGFPEETLSLAASLNKISGIKLKDTGLQADNYKKLIVSFSTDPQVIVIKLADRQEIMRSLRYFSKADQVRKAAETLFVYAPLAHQLGLYNQKKELEDLALRYTDPEAYRYISNKLKAAERDWEQFIAAFTAPIEKALKAQGLEYKLKSRTKSVYSIWKKMQAQKVGFDGVYDLFAIRFILDVPEHLEKAACWQVFSVVTNLYQPINERMRDWVTRPKRNGYSSLHITVKDPSGKVVEVQIRSQRMDSLAEMGGASHWSYKGIRSEALLAQWLGRVRDLLECPVQPEDSADYFGRFHFGEVFVFTPAGDLRRLPEGATVLDLAFAIHSNLGLRCTGAKIRGKMVPFRSKLQNGDVVEILTTKTQKPTSDWLNVVVTGKAKTKIRQKLREESGSREALGREILARRLKNWKLELTDAQLTELMHLCKYKSLADFYDAIGEEKLSPTEVKETLLKARQKAEEEAAAAKENAALKEAESKPAAGPASAHKNNEGKGGYLIIDNKLSQWGFKLAKCCNPVFGDEVFGFVSIKDGIKIHRISCPNAARLFDQYPYRIQKVKWKEDERTQVFRATLRFTGYEEPGLAHAVQEAAKLLGIDVREFDLTRQKDGLTGRLQVSVRTNQQVEALLFQLRKIKGIIKANRATHV